MKICRQHEEYISPEYKFFSQLMNLTTSARLKSEVVSNMPSFGYLKDMMATCIFLFVLSILSQSKVTVSKIWLQWFFSLAFLIDFIYTLIPSLHNTNFGQNTKANVIHYIYFAIVFTTLLTLVVKNVKIIADYQV